MSAMTIGTPKSVLPNGTTASVDDRRHHRQAGREPVVELVHVRRREILLQEELHGVGDRLEKSGRSDAIRSEAVLDQRADPALRVNGVGNHREDDQKDDGDDLQRAK